MASYWLENVQDGLLLIGKYPSWPPIGGFVLTQANHEVEDDQKEARAAYRKGQLYDLN